ncbi:bacillithiol biosynthesis deacetylase BshB2 [Ornithinibacillus gellani]|uniref:bacillithiol biosynthesis deacetylase BshB2 n=1 Tax=Ornithinibacillus gellani TaxID=2293253 RepID=UPI000F48D102|nr:bacillithiol biosynthesis deacetylase BshB2 [Ornithinibacillus gellani]TQS74807.1 bacillithiol biosynthesis deacetylase BshB2 [Ornithinibacillus gellani]
MEKHVVVIYPHPDDESFGAAGTISKFREQGVPVTYLCGTLGEMGRNMGSPPFANRETLPEIRKQELEAACQVLDMDLKLLGLRDKTIEYEDRKEIAVKLKAILEDIEPSLVITHYPGHAVHPDHNALGAAAVLAVEMMAADKRPVLWTQAITNTFVQDLGEPDVVQDITAYFDRKIEAIFCHRSQAGGMISKWTENETDEEAAKALMRERFGTERFFTWTADRAAAVE